MFKTALIVAKKPNPQNPAFTFLTLSNGDTIYGVTKECENQSAVTYQMHKKGDTFIATRDSNTKDKDGNPLYLKGEEVTRLQDSPEIKGYTTVEVWKALN